ncbi:hypothetical protein M408DRAFT_25977 [Serendipita vermifera MAFF 305830]|uniref:Uncharacterized protein n=1 Tax=Serendipita vermifera MAFF 305830 TaxID=933852 RepID=A0A0C2X8X3_SERVB|nr:hypothetical protein M408DRAFT_25977 [Serendipita vermifera MAFF 305830]
MSAPINGRAPTGAPAVPERLSTNRNTFTSSLQYLRMTPKALIPVEHDIHIELLYSGKPDGPLNDMHVLYSNKTSEIHYSGLQNTMSANRANEPDRRTLPLGREPTQHANKEPSNGQTPEGSPSEMDSAAERSKLLVPMIQQLHTDIHEAFSVPLVSVAFLPGDEHQKPKALLLESHSEELPSFTGWLRSTRGHEPAAGFMALLAEYTDYARKLEEKARRSKEAADSCHAGSKNGDLPIWCNGIHYLHDPKGVKTVPLRQMYRQAVYERWLACGWKEKKMPWRRVIGQPEVFMQEDAFPEGIQLKEAEDQSAKTIRKIIEFFIAHQNGSVPWEQGLLFKPAGKFPVQKFEVPISKPAQVEARMSLDIHSATTSLDGVTRGLAPSRSTYPLIVTCDNIDSIPASVPRTHGTSHIAAFTPRPGERGPTEKTATSAESRSLHADPSSSKPAHSPSKPAVSVTAPAENPVRVSSVTSDPVAPKSHKTSGDRKRTAAEAGIDELRPSKHTVIRK